MKKLILLTSFLTILSFGANAQISFDTTYHENLRVDVNEFDYQYDFVITNNATDPLDTVFTWEVTNVDRVESWDHMVLLPDYCGFINPTKPWNFILGKDTNTFIRLAFFLSETVGSGIIMVTINSKLHPEIKDSITLKINARSLASVGDLELNDMEVYPNPASDYLIIQTEPGASYTMTNLQGQVVKEGPLLNSISRIEIQDLSKGTYILKVLYEDKVGVRKVVVE